MSRPCSASPTNGQCGFMQCMRPCLKSPSPTPGFATPQLRKNVSFNDSIVDEVHIADDWTVHQRNLLVNCRITRVTDTSNSRRDILELKEIQRTLPRANQLDDPLTGKRAPHYLSSVPVGLLPLLPESPKTPNSSTDSPAKPITPISPISPEPRFKLNWMPLAPPPAPSIPPVQRAWHPPDLSHLTPAKPPPPRARPSFAFLPLLDTSSTESDIPSDSETSTDPPTPSLTNASLDSSPRSHVSSSLESSPEQSSMPLPNVGSERRKDIFASYLHGDDCDSSSFDDHESTLFSAPYRPGGNSSWSAFNAFPAHNKREPSRSPERPAAAPAPMPKPPTPAKKRNIMVLNGIEIDLDELEDAVSTPRTASPRIGVLTTPTPTPVDSNTPSASPQPSPKSHPIDLPPDTHSSPVIKSPTSPILSTSPKKRCGDPVCSPMLFRPDNRPRSAAT